MTKAIGWCVLGMLVLACGDDDDGAAGDGRGRDDADAAISAGTGASGSRASGSGASGRGGSGGGTSAGMLDPCTLLTPAEWEPLMEAAPTVDMRSGAGGSLMRCEWTHEMETRRQWGHISVAVAGAYGPSPMSMSIDIGDEGYVLATDRARTIDIGWKKSSLSATFKYSALFVPTGKDWPGLRDAAIELARLAASRMP